MRKMLVRCLCILSLTLAWAPPGHALVITEIMYHPPGDEADMEYIELYNEEAVAEDMSGYAFTNGIRYTFPEGFWLEPFEYIVVAKNPQAVANRYGVGNAMGPFEGFLDNGGERVTLSAYPPTDPQAPEPAILQTVRYNNRDRWPEAANGTGHSLVRVKIYGDPEDPSSWAASERIGGSPGGPGSSGPTYVSTTMVEIGAQWKLFQGIFQPSATETEWAQPDFVPMDALWPPRPTPLGYGLADLAYELTEMRGSFTGVFLRHTFLVDSLDGIDRIVLRMRFDDGFVAYLNGQEVDRANMGANIAFDATAISTHDPSQVQDFDITAFKDRLVLGENVLAVQAHNRSTFDIDFLFSCELLFQKLAEGDYVPPAVINEIVREADGDGWIEIHNPTSSGVDISGCHLTDDPRILDRYTFPDGTVVPARGFVVVPRSELPFRLNPDALTVFLVNPGLTAVVDAIALRADEAGLGACRYPDGKDWYHGTDPTPGEPNTVTLETDIVINEIMYHPFSEAMAAGLVAGQLQVRGRPPCQVTGPDGRGCHDDEYLELYNRGTGTVDLSGFAFARGINLELPQGTLIGPGEYLVIAKYPDGIAQKYGITNVLAVPYEGVLNNKGERILLVDRNRNPVDEVHYHDDGRWPYDADGCGPSLELIDPRADNARPGAWASSDEAARAEWHQYSYTGRWAGSDSEVHLLMAGRGEILFDDFRVEDTTRNYIRNGSFESGMSSWIADGTHVDSRIETGDAAEGNASLRIVASGRGDTKVNRIEQQTSPALPRNQLLTISFWAKWVRGVHQFTTRGYGPSSYSDNCFMKTIEIEVPSPNGTPGVRNSMFQENTAPTISDVRQDPVLPAPGRPVWITARVSDPDGVDHVTLFYRQDTQTAFSETPMLDDGQGNDGEPGDGIYGGSITHPAHGTNRSVIEFYVGAVDGAGAEANYPATAPAVNAAYAVDLQDVSRVQVPVYSICLARRQEQQLTSRLPMSNHLLSGTFVFQDRHSTEIYHNVGIRYRGSPWIRRNNRQPTSTNGWRVNFNNDEPFHGREEVNLDSQYRDQRMYHDAAVCYMLRKLGGAPYSRHIFPRVHYRGTSIGLWDDVQKVDRQFLGYWWPQDVDGNLHKADDYFEFTDSGTDFRVPDTGSFENSWEARLRYRGEDKDHWGYRWNYKLRSKPQQDDFIPLIEMMKVFEPTMTRAPEPFDTIIEQTVNVDEWLRMLAARLMVDDWDTIGGHRGKNAYIYLPPNDGRWVLIQWDSDLTFGNTGYAIIPSEFDNLRRMLTRPHINRTYYRYYAQLLDVVFNRPVMDPYLAKVRQAVQTAPFGASYGDIDTFINGRTSNILSRIQSRIPFEVTKGTEPITTTAPYYDLRGRAPVTVVSFIVNGSPVEPEFNTFTQWTLRVRLEPGENHITIAAFDYRGQLVGSDEVTIISTPPEITSVEPNSAPETGGVLVTICGTGFADGIRVIVETQERRSAVPPGDTTYLPPNCVMVKIPAGRGPADIIIVNPDGGTATLEDAFSYIPGPPPVISSVNPGSGPADEDTLVTIEGERFDPAVRVFLDDEELPADRFTYIAPGLIYAELPPGFGTIDITVMNPDGQTSTLEDAFTYTGGPPVFIRGDVDGDGKIGLPDAMGIALYIYSTYEIPCADVADADDSGKVEIDDALRVLHYTYGRGDPPAAPFPDPGIDETLDTLPCDGG